VATVDLTGILAKLQRADELCAALDTEVAAFTAKTYRVEGKFLESPPRFAFFAYGPPSLPPRFAVLAGEIVHQLRSSLDHAITQLAVQGPGGGNPNVLEFPVCRTPDSFKSSVQRGKLRGVADPMVQVIEALQPYNASKTVGESPLLCLHDLNRTDKHRLLLVVVASVLMGDRLEVHADRDVEIVGMSPPFGAGTRPAQNGTEIFSVGFGQKFDPTITISSNFGFKVVLDKVGLITDVPLIASLRIMRDAVVHVLGKVFPDLIKVESSGTHGAS
jgi:hypothetical protein